MGSGRRRRPDEIARLRGLDPEDCLPPALWKAYQERQREAITPAARTEAR